MLKPILFILSLFFQITLNYSFCQNLNLYIFSSENSKTNSSMENLAYSLYLEADLKLNNFKVFHYTPNLIDDTTWTDKKNKKKVIYKNNKLDCGLSLFNELNFLFKANSMIENDIQANYLLAPADFINKNEISNKFKIKEVNTNDGFTLQREINKIKEASGKNSCNIYCIYEGAQYTKPTFNFQKDTLYGNGEIEIKYTTSSKLRKLEWSSNAIIKNSNSESSTLKILSNQTIKASYIDENGCKSNEDELVLVLKEDCNCQQSSGKPEILYHRSPNVLKKQADEEAEWEYKLIPEGTSGDLKYEFAIKNVCGDQFMVEIKYPNGKYLFKDVYLRDWINESSSNPLSVKNKDLLAFIIPLDDKTDEILPPNNYFYISITPITKEGECINRMTVSKKVRFSKCR
jgi:hypothetical protein